MKQLIVLLFSCSLFLIGCKIPVQISVSVASSHCGGAPPSTDHTSVFLPLQEDIILISEGDSTLIRLDENGLSNLKLHKGLYQWFRVSKSYDTKIVKMKLLQLDSDFYVFSGDACIDEWKLKADGSFAVNSKSEQLKLTLKSSCYTKLYPCVKYVGPHYN